MSLNLIANITLDMLHPYASSTIVQVNQYDTAGSIKATLLNDGVSWNVPQGAKAVVMFKKTDNIGGFYDVTELNPETAAVTVDSNDRSIIYITLDQQTTTTATTAGQYVNMQVAFYQNGARLSTFAFYMQVQPSVVTSGDIHSNWLFNILSQEIAQILTDATTPEFISQWLENNITQETGYVIDDSLTIHGAASDAQATGKMVTVSDTNPGVAANKVWVKKTPSEIVVPTEDEVEDLRNALSETNQAVFTIATASATAVFGAYTYVDCNLIGGTSYVIGISASKPYANNISISSAKRNSTYIDNNIAVLPANKTSLFFTYTPTNNVGSLRFIVNRSDSCIYTVSTYLDKIAPTKIKTDETYNRLAEVVNYNAAVDKTGYVKVSNGLIDDTPNASRTDYISTDGYTKIRCYDRITSVGYVLAYYDEYKSLLSSVSVIGSDAHDSVYDIPSTAKYVIYSRYGTGDTYCILYNENSLSNKVIDLDERVSAIEEVAIKTFRNFTILGDSFSTFNGYQNPSTNAYWYPNENNTLSTVGQCWWHKFAKAQGCYLVQNNSFSGSPICYDGLGEGTVDAKEKSFVTRCRNLTNADLIIIEGATNDSQASMGSYKYSDWTESDFETFRPALAYVLDYCINHYVGSTVIFMLNNGLSNDIKTSVQTICEHYEVPLLELDNISKESNHPSPTGMEQIKTQLINFLNTLS